MMDRKEQLKAVIDGIIKGDEEGVRQAFSSYVQTKSREILGYGNTEEPVTEHYLITQIRESLEDVPVKLQGDRVVVDGKVVGVIQADPTDFDSGINFIEDGGAFSKEFNTVDEFFNFVIDRYAKDKNK